jgi:hypothetical protein
VGSFIMIAGLHLGMILLSRAEDPEATTAARPWALTVSLTDDCSFQGFSTVARG